MIRATIGLVAVGAVALAQQTFEVASVKPVAPDAAAGPMGGRGMARARDAMYDSRPRGWLPLEKTRLSLKDRPLRGLIASAYRVRSSEVSGPAWMKEVRFDIEATFPEGTPKEAVNEMLRALLEERFGLVAHRESREEAGYALVEAKGGAKLNPAAVEQKPAEDAPLDDDARQAQMQKMQENMQKRMAEMRAQAAANGGGGFSSNGWGAKAVTLQQVADWLAPLVAKPVVDATGIAGKYDMDLRIVRFGDDTQEHAIAEALAKLGLKLEARKVTVGTVVVDKVERTPKEN